MSFGDAASLGTSGTPSPPEGGRRRSIRVPGPPRRRWVRVLIVIACVIVVAAIVASFISLPY
ncbi:MAG: hypothetical protein ACRD0B_11295, partial [Acidimicrobiales bacterium]